MFVGPFRGELDGAQVLHLAGADHGRWSYALAAQAVGIEARQEMVDRYKSFPEMGFKAKIGPQNFLAYHG